MSIRIDITPLLASVGRTLKIEEEETVSYPEDNLVLTAPVKVVGEFLNTGETILFSGRVKTAVRLACGHCLKDFDHPLDFSFEEEYSKKPQRIASTLTDKDFVFNIEPDNSIDLSEVIRQNIITELPIRPLCDKLCPGPDEKNKEEN